MGSLSRALAPIDRRALDDVAGRTRNLEGRYSYLMMRFKGKPAAGTSETQSFPIDLAFFAESSFARAKVAATGAAVWGLSLEGVSVGSITFAPGELVGEIACSLVKLPAFQEFEVTPPTPEDATLADVTLAFATQR